MIKVGGPDPAGMVQYNVNVDECPEPGRSGSVMDSMGSTLRRLKQEMVPDVQVS